MGRFRTSDELILMDFMYFEPSLSHILSSFLRVFGATLAELQPRFAQRADPNRIFEQDRFEFLLGMDVAHDTHPIKQFNLLSRMVADPSFRTGLSATDIRTLQLTEITHDMGEAVVKADIAFQDKTAQDEADELEGWAHAVEVSAPAQYKDRILDTVRPVLSGEDARLHELFALTERVGCVETGIAAGHLALNQTQALLTTPAEKQVLAAIAYDVGKRNAAFIESERATLPILDGFLKEHEPIWLQMQSAVAA